MIGTGKHWRVRRTLEGWWVVERRYLGPLWDRVNQRRTALIGRE